MAEAPWRGVGGGAHSRCRVQGGVNMIGVRQRVATSVLTLLLVFSTARSSAQVVVFDPNNYAQNLLTAARALQQVNNQITSLQNQAQMLINQARNLANLPFSSLQPLQQSLQRTQKVLAQAQTNAQKPVTS